jgi:hypothetical protein
MTKTPCARAPEFSRVLKLSDLPDGDATRRLEATDEERAAIAGRLGIDGLESLHGDIVVRRGRASGTYAVSGRLVADVVQTCVVTLAPVRTHIDTEFETIYADATAIAALRAEESHDAEPPEPIVGDRIDLGEELVQQLACAVDPYPRAAGAEVDDRWVANSDRDEETRPFAVLSRIRQR